MCKQARGKPLCVSKPGGKPLCVSKPEVSHCVSATVPRGKAAIVCQQARGKPLCVSYPEVSHCVSASQR